MMIREPLAEETVQRLLAGVLKPARYTGGEVNSVVDRGDPRARLALCFPDVYEVAESHLGLKILYDIVNRAPGFAAERCYALWPDLEAVAREAGVPIWSLESYRPLGGFELVGFTLPYELGYATMVAMLEHGGITPRATERAADEPFVIAGGACAYNPEPVAEFLDAVLLGDGEAVILPLLEAVAAGRERGAGREAILEELGALPGVYVPSHYEVAYDHLRVTDIRARPGGPKAGLRSRHDTPRITRAVVSDLEAAPFPEKLIIPNVAPVHERATVEIQRGCSRACRFCQAGMTTRPTRQRSPKRVLELADALLDSSGCEEVGLLSLSAGDYGRLDELLLEFFRRHEGEQVNVSLPSLRTESMTPELAARIATVRKSGFTLAPEAGSERLRAVINKTNREEDLLAAVRSATRAGWRLLKLYFMIGLPTEREADVDAIVELARRARAVGREVRSDFKLTVSVSTFVPKPHTPFQWARQLDSDGARAIQERLREQLRAERITLRYHDAEQSFLEGVLCRGDRRLAPAILAAARAGCRLDAWSEHYDHATWTRVLDEVLSAHGLRAGDYLAERAEDQLLPWDHLDAGVLKKFLRRDLKRALVGDAVGDCALTDRCYACGGCDIADPYGERSERGRRAAEVRPRIFAAPPVEPPASDASSIVVAAAATATATAAAADTATATATAAAAAMAAATDDAAAGGRQATPAGDGARPAPNSKRRPPALDREPPPDPADRARLRFRYAKRGRVLHISHLATKDMILRAVRLAKMPVLYTRGFTPRPRVSFSPACPTGIFSEAEYFEVLCHGAELTAEPWMASLAAYLPDGFSILDARAVDPRGPAVDALISTMTYEVGRPATLSRPALEGAVAAFTASPQRWVRVLRKRKARLLDARAQIRSLAVTGDRLRLVIVTPDSGTLKVREAVAAVIGREHAEDLQVCKTEVEIAKEPAERINGGSDDGGDEAREVVDLRQLGEHPGRGGATRTASPAHAH